MEDKPFEFIPAAKSSPFILTCEHAAVDIPDEYHHLGLSDADLNKHIARDKGAGDICRLLAEKLGCAAFLGKYSRLLIDLNRRTDESELIVKESDKMQIPGNADLSDAERQKRIDRFYAPYYKAINAYIDNMKQQGITPVIFSIHSYTPQLKGGNYRPWQAGVLYHKPAAFADYLYKNLAKSSKVIGENVPYDLRQYNTGAVIICGEEKGLDYGLIEIRDDEFDNLAAGAAEWAQILSDIMLKYRS